jgi:hypothetical protein
MGLLCGIRKLCRFSRDDLRKGVEGLGHVERAGVPVNGEGDTDGRFLDEDETARRLFEAAYGRNKPNSKKDQQSLLSQDANSETGIFHSFRREGKQDSQTENRHVAVVQEVSDSLPRSGNRQRRTSFTAVEGSGDASAMVNKGDPDSPAETTHSHDNLLVSKFGDSNSPPEGTYKPPTSVPVSETFDQPEQNSPFNQLASPSNHLNRSSPSHFFHPLTHVHAPHFHTGATGLFSPQGHVTTSGRPVVTSAYLHSLLGRDVRRWEAIASGESPMMSPSRRRRMQAQGGGVASQGDETVELALGGGIEAIG